MNHNSYLVEKFPHDLKAGITVSLVAIPLCLGIALASGVPPIAGLIAGIIGGIIVGILSDSAVSVSGCAAGLVPVVLSAITELGALDLFFVAVVFSGVIQYIFGVLRIGIIAHYIPSAVLKGMLAAIGIIIILKQIPYIFGYNSAFDESMALHYDSTILSNTMYLFYHMSYGSVIISIISFAILYFTSKNHVNDDKFVAKIFKYLPGSLLLIIVSVFVNGLFKLYFPSLELTPEYLVNIPDFNGLFNSSTLFSMDPSGLKNILIYKYAVILAIIGSIETLLSIEASDKLDRQRRVTHTSVELKAQGIGNMLSGLLHGLPITSVMIRSSVNIENNAQTKMATIIHGIVLLLCILCASSFINQIPLASLACILIATGYKLTHEKILRDMFKKGSYQFFPFVITILAILATDLLVGVMIGLIISIFFILRTYYNLSIVNVIKNEDLKEWHLKFHSYTTFLSKANIKMILDSVPNNSKLILDFSECIILDQEIQELINAYRDNAYRKNIELIINNSDSLNPEFSLKGLSAGYKV
jgi:MFS superfamily sulfate permease-like transporter